MCHHKQNVINPDKNAEQGDTVRPVHSYEVIGPKLHIQALNNPVFSQLKCIFIGDVKC